LERLGSSTERLGAEAIKGYFYQPNTSLKKNIKQEKYLRRKNGKNSKNWRPIKDKTF